MKVEEYLKLEPIEKVEDPHEGLCLSCLGTGYLTETVDGKTEIKYREMPDDKIVLMRCGCEEGFIA